MPRKKSAQVGYPRLPGTVHANIQIPQALHEAMKALRRIRRQIEMEDIKLCKLYREAVEQYIAAKPQQRLLAEFHAEPADAFEGVEAEGVSC